jgi:hypothetical protein
MMAGAGERQRRALEGEGSGAGGILDAFASLSEGKASTVAVRRRSLRLDPA